MIRRDWMRIGAGMLAAGGITPALAQEFPSRIVRLVVGFPPGGSVDIITRDIGNQLAAAWGQPVIVENRSGANGTIATAALATSPPDGHTLMMTVSSHITNPFLYRQLSYDVREDFAPVSLVASSPLVIMAHPSFAASEIRELLSTAKEKPGDITYSTPGIGSVQHLSMELMNYLAGTKMTHVPYRGGAGALSDLLGGQVHLSILSIVQALPFIQQNQVKVLAVTTANRSSLLPNVPTLAESGVGGYESSLWYGIIAPAGTPAQVIAKVNHDVTRIVTAPAMRTRLSAQGADPIPSTPQEFEVFLKDEYAKWERVFRETGIKPD
jgi:tripartite-type tricarboxylate transporter receptor subunit TctC